MANARVCLVCDAPSDLERCSACGSRTLARDDPEVLELREAEHAAASHRRDAQLSWVGSFVVGLPVFALALSWTGIIPAVIVAAGAVFGTTKLIERMRGRRR